MTERNILGRFDLDELPTNPARPKSLKLVDQVGQSISTLVGMFYNRRRFLKVDPADRLLVCEKGQEANRATQTRVLAAGLPITVILQPDTITWALAVVGGGVEVDMQNALGASLGAFTIPQAGTWVMHHLPYQVVLTASIWTPTAATHICLIEWRRA